MKFNHAKFFTSYISAFGRLSLYQKAGIERLLLLFAFYDGWWENPAQIANALAQVKHETAHSFQPVVEGFYIARTTPPDFQGKSEIVRRFQRKLRYYPHFGMGDIQLTWRENYVEHDRLIRKYFPELVEDFRTRTGTDFNLAKFPSQALDGKISFAIFTIGMHKGTFREGHTLDRYINANSVDHFGARNIVNGDRYYKDKAGVRIGDKIAADAVKFEKILRASIEKQTPANAPFSINDEEIDLLTENISPDRAAQTPVPSVDLPDSPPDSAYFPQIPPIAGNESPDFNIPSSEENIPPGDTPEAEPRAWLRVEDWKPFVFKWIKRVWGFFTGLNFAQISGLSVAGASDPENRWMYIGAAIFILFVLFVFVALATLALLAVWYFNRKEINSAHEQVADSVGDPTKFNLGLIVEPVGKAKSEIKRIIFSKL